METRRRTRALRIRETDARAQRSVRHTRDRLNSVTDIMNSDNHLKLFDKIGIVVVAVWVGLAGFYIYHTQSSAGSGSSQRSDQFAMREGGTWLVLRRHERDAGFVHQTRTELADGWLLEHDTYMVVDLFGSPQLLDASVKTRLDIDGFLRQFTTEIHTSGGLFKATGRVEGDTLHLSQTLGEEADSETLTLDEPVRMAPNALNTLRASAELRPGESYRGRYVDPYLAALVDVEMRYIEHRELEVYDETFPADHFRKKAGETRELDFYIDEDADLLIRAFPLRMTGARIPAALGKTRSASIRRQLDKRREDAAQQAGEDSDIKTLSIDLAQRILAGQYGPDEALADEDLEDTPEMKIAE